MDRQEIIDKISITLNKVKDDKELLYFLMLLGSMIDNKEFSNS